MDKNGIGTDATIHQHIEKILERGYAYKLPKSKLFTPTYVGNFLLDAYWKIGLSLHDPTLRAKMENDMKEIAEGNKTREEVVSDVLKEMKGNFNKLLNEEGKMREYLKQ